MAEERVQRRLLAILAADVVGYIRLMGVHGAAVSGASLCNLDKLPPKGAILIAASLKIVNGTGSPFRALALDARN
jgi:hypothetical protein